MKKVFIEVYPYHSETLYPYADAIGGPEDIVLYNPTSQGKGVLARLHMRHADFSIKRLIKILWREKISEVHINSISVNLHGRNWAPWRKAFAIVSIPYICRLFGVSVFGIAHEADQYFATPVNLNRRHNLYRKYYGRFHKRLFSDVYVLAPEIKNYIAEHGGSVSVMSTRSLTKLSAVNVDKRPGLTLAWIGAMDSQRRNWQGLYEIDAGLLSKTQIMFDMICDIRAAKGPDFEEKIGSLGISHGFFFRRYRPDDEELFAAVKACDIVVGFYAHESYGKVKTSGARHIALAFDKPVLVYQDGHYQLIGSEGVATIKSTDINQLLERAVQLQNDEQATLKQVGLSS